MPMYAMVGGAVDRSTNEACCRQQVERDGGKGRQLNSVNGEAESFDSAFSLPEISGESAVSGVDDVLKYYIKIKLSARRSFFGRFVYFKKGGHLWL